MTDTIAICDSEGVRGMSPQGSVFHWRYGWMFCRGEANAVHVWNTAWSDGSELKIPAGEWDSIVKHLAVPNGDAP